MSMKLAGRVFDYKVSPHVGYLLVALCDVAQEDGSHCFAGEDYLCWKTGVHRATLYRQLARLEALGVITNRTLRDGRIERQINLAALPVKPGYQQPKRGGRRTRIASNGATPHGNVPADTRPTRKQQPEPPAAPAAGDTDTWQPPDADSEPFDLSGRTDADRAADLAAERYAGLPPTKRSGHTRTRGGLGGWPT